MENKRSKEIQKKELLKGDLNNGQLQSLKTFLRKCDYRKVELATESPGNLLINEELIRDPKKSMSQLIQYLIQKFNLEWLISKIAFDLYIKFEKAISQGQAEAVIRRILGIKLSSTGRSQLHELRRKIRKYKKLVTHFEEWAKWDYTLKIVIMGLNAEQKNVLLKVRNITPPVGVEFFTKHIEIFENKIAKLQIWSLSIKEQFRSLISQYCKGTTGAIIAFDKSDYNSFELIKEFYQKLKNGTNLKFKLTGKKEVYAEIPVFIIGIGDSNVISSKEGQLLAKELGVSGYIEISDLELHTFEEMLYSLVLLIIKSS